MSISVRPYIRRTNRGSILFLTLLFLVLINLFAVAFWKLVPVEMNSARRHLIETEAYFASDAGVTDAIAFLEKRTALGNIDNYINSNGVTDSEGNKTLVRTGKINGWNWEARIVPGPETYGHKDYNSPNPIRVFKVEAVARKDGFSTNSQQYRKVSAWVRQKSFAKDGWGVNGAATNSLPLWLNLESFRLGGTYRTNDRALVRIPGESFWTGSQPAAIGGELLFAVNSSNSALNQIVDGVEYYSFSSQTALPYNKDTGSALAGRYEKIVSGGRNAVRKVDVAVLPPSTDSVAFGVWGGPAPTSALTKTGSFFGTSHAVNARINEATPGGAATNGIYVEGDIKQIDFSINNGNQVTKIYQGGGSTQFVEVRHITDNNFTIPAGSTVSGSSAGTTLRPSDNGGKGWTVIKDGGSNKYIVYQDQTNGAIYSTGNIDGIRGTVHGRRTVATQTDTGAGTDKDRRININGDLTYKSTTPGQTPASTEDMLGLISYAVLIQDAQATSAPTNSNPQLGKTWPIRSATSKASPLFLYTSIFAGRENDPRKSLSNASEVGGGFGTKSHTDKTLGSGFMKLYGSINEGVRLAKGQFDSTTGIGTAGMQYAFELDPGLEQVQPPFFPTLPKYDLITWEEKSVFSY